METQKEKCAAAVALAEMRHGIKEKKSERKAAAGRQNLIKARAAKLAKLTEQK